MRHRGARSCVTDSPVGVRVPLLMLSYIIAAVPCKKVSKRTVGPVSASLRPQTYMFIV